MKLGSLCKQKSSMWRNANLNTDRFCVFGKNVDLDFNNLEKHTFAVLSTSIIFKSELFKPELKQIFSRTTIRKVVLSIPSREAFKQNDVL